MSDSIFEVDIAGLRQLQEGKPKWFIIRELLQNAIDEDITKCTIYLKHTYGKAHIVVEDDSPIGFRDLSDAYTLFKDTYKRANATKRGRFNFGEKQVLCMADYATIKTTTGQIEFDLIKGKKKVTKTKRSVGSEVYVVVPMSKEEYNECCNYANDILVPENISIVLNIHEDKQETELIHVSPFKSFNAKLKTEVKEDDRMRTVTRATTVNVHRKEVTAYIYEMGIPVCEIECDYSIDVQQRIPLSNDRDKVDAAYLKTIYGEVLNQVIDDISPEQSSQLWVRTGFVSDRVTAEVCKDVLTKRFGEKRLIANPNDKRSMDEAISNNFNVVYGAEMNKDEWNVIKQNELMVSTSSQFKTGIAEGTFISNPTDNQIKIANFAKKIAREFLDINLTYSFYHSPDASVKADYNSEEHKLRFNLAHFSTDAWRLIDNRIKPKMLDLILHELGHSAGWHYEHSYHECLTMLGSSLTFKALEDPNWFNIA